MLKNSLFLALVLSGTAALADVEVRIVYLQQAVEHPPTLSNLDPIPEDLGVAGALVGLDDNRTTGRFLGQTYEMDIVAIAPGGVWEAGVVEALSRSDLVVLDAPADQIGAALAVEGAADALFFNVSAPDLALREDACAPNLLHTLPSVAMETDALAQFFVKRRWTDLAMVVGTQEGDLAYAEAMRQSATKFGLRIRGEKTWAFDADMRRNAAQEVPVFTQDFPDHDALVVVDTIDDFDRYIAFNTWLPRPVSGTDGLTAVAWAPVVEQWGAAQLQSRFVESATRPMRPGDYAAWAAIRTLGEAVTRTSSSDASVLRAYILSDTFELAGFKGRPMTYRPWNGQLRQPIPLVHARALVANAPLEGFLHQHTELDTLGIDAPESSCTAFTE